MRRAVLQKDHQHFGDGVISFNLVVRGNPEMKKGISIVGLSVVGLSVDQGGARPVATSASLRKWDDRQVEFRCASGEVGRFVEATAKKNPTLPSSRPLVTPAGLSQRETHRCYRPSPAACATHDPSVCFDHPAPAQQ
jgi:hypothetical protein